MGLFSFLSTEKGRARRKARRENRQANRAMKKADRRKFKLAKMKTHADAKTDRVKLRQQGKTTRTQFQTDADKVAYENGLIPKHKGDGLEKFGEGVLDVVGSVFGKSGDIGQPMDYEPGDHNGDNNGGQPDDIKIFGMTVSPILIGFGALLLLLIFGKKR